MDLAVRTVEIESSESDRVAKVLRSPVAEMTSLMAAHATQLFQQLCECCNVPV